MLWKITKPVEIQFKPCLDDLEPIILKPCLAPYTSQMMTKILTSQTRNFIMDISYNLSNTMRRIPGAGVLIKNQAPILLAIVDGSSLGTYRCLST